jgi:hypothetical protein
MHKQAIQNTSTENAPWYVTQQTTKPYGRDTCRKIPHCLDHWTIIDFEFSKEENHQPFRRIQNYLEQ